MAFGYEYLIVYLPEFNPESFLLFVHNPAGSTKLRDYSSGRERVLGQPALSDVAKITEFGKSRFSEDPYTVSGPDGVSHWRARIADYNSRYLLEGRQKVDSKIAKPTEVLKLSRRTGVHGRALRGSQRQIQDYVNIHQNELNRAVLEALPAQLTAVVQEIAWASPLAADDYAELRDGDFFDSVGLGDFKKQLTLFWPTNGPCWDALAKITTTIPNSVPIAILVEAKSHIPEIYGSGCQASPGSRTQIETALARAKKWCGAKEEGNWTGPLYQSANRIAHLYFIREQLRRPVWMINVYFTHDPIRSTSREDWLSELGRAKFALGIDKPVPGLLELFLPALDIDQDSKNEFRIADSCPSEQLAGQHEPNEGEALARTTTTDPILPPSMVNANDYEKFSIWRERWTALADYPGAFVPDAERRIQQGLELWNEPIPGRWQRGIDLQLLSNRYRRGDIEKPHLGEHAIEHEILISLFDGVACLGLKLVDGVNAFPLCMDIRRLARNGNVEADMLLLANDGVNHHLFLCEVKDQSDNAWYATIEALRQLKLFLSNPESRRVFVNRKTMEEMPEDLPVSSLVIAPEAFYLATGKKQNAVEPAQKLIERFRECQNVDVRLTVWDRTRCEIRDLI